MRYAPPGMCLNDFTVLAGPDGYTVLHLQGPWTAPFDHLRMETSYGRATSTDLVRWQTEGTAFGVGPPGRFDQAAVWTMHAIPHGDGLAMLYTGVGCVTADGWPVQAVGLARSHRRDGTGWLRHGTVPVSCADPRWYRTGDGMGWRDPFVVRDDEGPGWAMAVCAGDVSLPVERAGCVALATSPDLEHWQAHPPLVSPGDRDHLECPVLERVADGWLLFTSTGGIGGGRVDTWAAPWLRGPWRRIGPLAPVGVYAPRVVTAPDGARVVLHTTPRRVGLSDRAAYCRGMLAQPKALAVPGAGPPRLEWWPGLDRWLGPPVSGRPVPDGCADVAVRHDPEALDGSAPGGPGGAGGSGARGGAVRTEVVLRAEGEAPALAVGCQGRAVWVAGPGGGPLAGAEAARPPRRLRILTAGEYVEVYADDAFLVTALCYTGRPVPWTVTRTPVADAAGGEPAAGPWAGTAATKPEPVPVRPLTPPYPDRDDASALWPGPRNPG
ncbi:mucin-1 [Streptomyces sp. B1866]|uniref:mucin-1 n=1 Tax=Streptomyces sp. B1866 TaxID=3075431 RepID=UPI002890190D|nr:mucin-1 [Streptomyces sp. B1866]MDT3398747.1 mucin-1 [Streptomyces sp. B1866]